MHVVLKDIRRRFAIVFPTFNVISIPVMLFIPVCAFSSCSAFLFSGLSYGTDDQGLREAFTSFGEVIEGV